MRALCQRLEEWLEVRDKCYPWPSCADSPATVPARAVDPDAATIEISGPFSIFRRTMLHGRSLAELLPLLAWYARFQLRAA